MLDAPVTRRGDNIDIGNVQLKTKVELKPKPNLPKEESRKLRAISQHLSFQWNAYAGYWEVWFDNKLNEPYIVARVTDDHKSTYRPIDNRVYEELKKAFWESQRRWIERRVEMERKAEYAHQKREEYEYDMHYQSAKEIVPVLRTLHDAGNSSHGKSKFLWQGADLK